MTIATPFTILVVLIIAFFNVTRGLQFHSRNTSGASNKKIKNTAILHTHKTDTATTGITATTATNTSRRRQLIFAGVGGVAGICLPSLSSPPSITGRQVNALYANAAVSSPFEQPSLRRQPYEPRVAGLGDDSGAVDLLLKERNQKPLADIDILYPPSMNGTWVCTRTVISVDGDRNQAEGAWKLLGGSGSGPEGGFNNNNHAEESYYIRFVDLRRPTDGIIGMDGKRYYGVILDRGYELEERTRNISRSEHKNRNNDSDEEDDINDAGKSIVVTWDPRKAPNILQYEKRQQHDGGAGRKNNNNGIATELTVVQRQVEPQNNKGSLVGSNELIRITTTTKATTKNNLLGLFGEVVYAARIQRRFRRMTTEEGDRVVEGIEIQKTYRVLDGIVDITTPTSTTKSKLRLTRTYPTRPTIAITAHNTNTTTTEI